MFEFLPLFGFFLLGLVCQRVIDDPMPWVKWVNTFIIYLSFPAIILLKVPLLEFHWDVFIPASTAWLWALLVMALVWQISRLLHWSRELTGAVMILTTMGNTAFLGVPLTQFLFGNDAVAYAIIYDQFGSFLILSTLGLTIIARYSQIEGAQAEPFRPQDMLRRVVKFPPFIALMISLFLPIHSLVSSFEPALMGLSSLLMPLALLVLGLQFRPKLLPHHRQPLIVALSLKMVLAPLLVWFYLLLLGEIESRVVQATMLQAATPGMITPGLLAIAAGIAPRLIATVLGYGAVISLFTLPFLAYLLQ